MNQPIHCGDKPLVVPPIPIDTMWDQARIAYAVEWILRSNLPDHVAKCPTCKREWSMYHCDQSGGYVIRDFHPIAVEDAQSVVGRGYDHGPILGVDNTAARILVTRSSVKTLLGEPTPTRLYGLGKKPIDVYDLEQIAAVVGTSEHLKAILRRQKVEPHIRSIVEAVRDGQVSVSKLRGIWLKIIDDKLSPLSKLALLGL